MKFNNANEKNVYSHIKDKYPDVYRERFQEELEAFKKLVNELTLDGVLEIWEAREL